MNMDPWYKIATPRKEDHDGRSFNPDEFAIYLEQVIARIVPGGLSGSKTILRSNCLYTNTV